MQRRTLRREWIMEAEEDMDQLAATTTSRWSKRRRRLERTCWTSTLGAVLVPDCQSTTIRGDGVHRCCFVPDVSIPSDDLVPRRDASSMELLMLGSTAAPPSPHPAPAPSP